jgi:hypothetical protein
MNFIEENILGDEEILYRAEVHWAVFIWTFVLFIIGLPFFGGNTVSKIIGLVFIAIADIREWIAFINFSNSVIAVTNRRVVAKVGFIRMVSLVVPVAEIGRVEVIQSRVGRILNCGTVVIILDGGGKYTFRRIASPFELRRQLDEQILLLGRSKNNDLTTDQ